MGKPLRVLFVEDSEDDAELTTAELSRGGFDTYTYRVDTAAGMCMALAEGEWDVVISDYHMPRFSAEEALETLKDSGRDLPFIILSGVVQAEEAVTLLKRGAHDFLNKETLARLVPAVEREMREAAERSHRRHAEERVSILSLAVEQSPVSVVLTDRNGVIEYVNPKFEEVTGYCFSEAVGRNLDFTVLDQSNGALFSDLWETVKDGQNWRGEFCNVRRDDQLFWEYANVSPLKNESGEITHFVAVKEDITVRRSYEEQLLRQAHYDELTGLANRVLMLDRLDLAIKTAVRNGTEAALLCIDLDRFKYVNDTLGHSVGDELLKEASARLSTCIRKCDTLARMGGDEFVIILPQIDSDTIVRRIAERVVDVFAKPFRIGEQDHYVTASIGIVLFPNDGADHQVLLRNADLAMYKAKDLGRNRYQFFTEDINGKLKERLSLEAKLRGVVERQELELHYQPIFDLQTSMPVAFEALVRWRQADGELCMPNKFISLAEDVGLIKDIGDWVIATACADIASLLRHAGDDLRVAVNVSPKQLQVRDFSDYIEHQLRLNNLQPWNLELEITESVLVDDLAETHVNLQALCDLGVSLSIDDFGTGYSSLGYLQKYPFQTLKIDRSFVSNATDNSNSARLVETIIAMAHGLGLRVIAEGVETDEQLSFLSPRACDQVQGYLFSPPVPAKQLNLKLSGQRLKVARTFSVVK